MEQFITGPDYDDLDEIPLSDSDKPEQPLPPLPADSIPVVMTRLDMATEEELILELARRNNGLVVAIDADIRGEPGKFQPKVRWSGGALRAHGLALYAGRFLAKYLAP